MKKQIKRKLMGWTGKLEAEQEILEKYFPLKKSSEAKSKALKKKAGQ